MWAYLLRTFINSSKFNQESAQTAILHFFGHFILQHIWPDLHCIQLSVKACTDHWHQVRHTSVLLLLLVAQQVPTNKNNTKPFHVNFCIIILISFLPGWATLWESLHHSSPSFHMCSSCIHNHFFFYIYSHETSSLLIPLYLLVHVWISAQYVEIGK